MGVSATLFNAKKVTYAIKKTIKHFLLKWKLQLTASEELEEQLQE
jgi:hypothetical protein